VTSHFYESAVIFGVCERTGEILKIRPLQLYVYTFSSFEDSLPLLELFQTRGKKQKTGGKKSRYINLGAA